MSERDNNLDQRREENYFDKNSGWMRTKSKNHYSDDINSPTNDRIMNDLDSKDPTAQPRLHHTATTRTHTNKTIINIPWECSSQPAPCTQRPWYSCTLTPIIWYCDTFLSITWPDGKPTSTT